MKKKRYTDEELIEGLRHGEDDVLHYLYEHYFKVFRNYVLKSYGSEEEARDIFQEVVVVIYNKLQKSNFKITSSFFTFFYAVFKNTWLNYRKLSKKNPLINSADFSDEINRGVDTGEIEEIAHKALKSKLIFKYFSELTDGCQKLLNYFLADYSTEEIARELDFKSTNYVRKRKSICLSTLIEKIKKDALFKELL